MVVKITVSLDNGNSSLDNTWLLGNDRGKGNEMVEVKPINALEKKTDSLVANFNIIFENNKVFLACSEFVEEINPKQPKNIILKDLHVMAEFIQETNDCFKQYTSINNYFAIDDTLFSSNVDAFDRNINLNCENNQILKLK